MKNPVSRLKTLCRAGALLQLAACQMMLLGMSPARAQTTLPVFPEVDTHGVDVATGNFNYSQTDVTIGPSGRGGLSYTLSWVGSAQTMNYAGGFGIAGFTCTVSIGTSAETFTSTSTGCTGTITSDQQRGSTLVASGSNSYTYTTADHTAAVFVWEPGNGVARIRSISRPDGVVITYNYEIGTITCLPDPQHCYAQTYPERLISIANNFGYMLAFGYSGTADQTVIPNRVTGVNTTVEFCRGTDCAQSWPYATYTYDSSGNPLTSTNADGATTTFSYTQPSGSPELLSGVQFADQGTHNVNVTFDSNNRVHIVNFGFGSWSYAYSDSSGSRTTTVTNPDSSSRTYVSTIATGTISSFTNERSEPTSYAYDSASRLTQVTLPDGNNTQYTYDGRGNVTQTVQVPKTGSGLSNIVTSAVFPASCFDPTCNEPTSTTDARGYRTDYTYNTTHGGVTQIDSPAPNGAAPVGSGIRPEKRFAYAQFQVYYLIAPGTWTTGPAVWMPTSTSVCATGQAPSCVGTSDETLTTLTYPASGSQNNPLASASTIAAGDGSVSSSTAMTYTSAGDLLTVDGPLAGTADTTRYYYDPMRRPLGVVGPSPDGTATYRARKVTYNGIGQPTDMEGGTVTSQSDSALTSSFTSLAKQDTVYDGYARPLYARVWASGSVVALTQFSYDSVGRIRCTAVRMNPSAFNSLPSDACSQGSAGADGPDRIDLKSYWPDGSLSSEQTGVGTADAQTTASYSYNANGTVASLTDARGYVTTYTYDGFDRLVQQNYPNPSTPGQSNPSDFDQRTFDAFGRLTGELRRGETFGYAYYNGGAVSSRSAPERTVSYTYDLLGRVQSQSEPGSSLSATYDAISRVRTQSSSVLGTIGYQYDAAGRRTRLTYPDGFYIAYGYDTVGDLTGEFENGGTQIVGFSYDGLGRRATLTRSNGVTTSYSYDGASRLATLTQALSSPYNNSISFTYNAASQIDNRTSTSTAFSQSAPTGAISSYGADGLNRYTSASGFTPTYGDGRGNLTGDGTRTYSYDSDNRLTSASGGTTLAYDPASRLASVVGSAGTTQFLYDGSDVIAEYDGSATPVLLRRYVHGPGQDEPLVWYEGTGTTNKHWLLADERGSVIAMTDGSGTVTQVDKYNADGLPDSGNSGRFQFTGQMWISEASVYHFKARAYHPGLGRFMQTDPSGFAGGLNLYAYANGDPVNFADPSGLDTCVISYHEVDNWGPDPSANGMWSNNPSFTPDQFCWPDPTVEPPSLGPSQPGGGTGTPGSPNAPGTSQTKPSHQIQRQPPCSDLASLDCEVCVNTYLNNTYGNFGGFIASTFNVQGMVPGLSGDSPRNTIQSDLAIGGLKFGLKQGLTYVGNSILEFSTTSGTWFTGASIEYAGYLVPEVLAGIGVLTTPFATTAMIEARQACGE